MADDSILWRRLDVPGHDACRIERTRAGWLLEGTAVSQIDCAPAVLAYQVECDASWRTRHGVVRGRLDGRAVELLVSTAGGVWRLDDRPIAGLDRCVDLDLGFTPATNLLPIRRLALAAGQAGDAPAAWLNLTDGTLTALAQRYERRSDSTYWYEAPTLGYAAELEVTPTGWVRKYPGLWEEES